MKPHLALLYLLLFIYACESGTEATQQANPAEAGSMGTPELFAMEKIPGLTHQLATKKDQERLVEEGITDAKGQKNGIWVIYQGERAYPEKIANYINGVYNGPYFEFDGFGRMTLKATYRNNKLHGDVAKYLNGNLYQESQYKDGVLDGIYKEYNTRGVIQKEIHYKEGKLDGIFRAYDADGKVSVEYTYKNGKQQ